MKINKYPVIFLFLLGLFLQEMNGQDLHFSQYYNSPLNLNPALAGLFGGDIRYNANYRKQWSSVPVPFTTFSGAWDQKFYGLGLEKGLVSGGAVFNYDQAGDGDLTYLELGVGGSYTRTLNPSNFLSFGAQFSFGQRSFDYDKLTWHNQWNGDIYDQTIDPRESFSSTNKFIFKTGVGANYRWQKSPRTKFDIGVGFMNLNKPNVAFYDQDNITLESRLNIVGLGNFKLANSFDLLVSLVVQLQGEYQEILLGPALKFYINQQRGKELAIQVGLDYRLDDAFAPTAQIYWTQWQLGFSYDVNFSEFDQATDKNGGPELYLRYIITKLRPKEYKICPIY